jgi:hypothetical protein
MMIRDGDLDERYAQYPRQNADDAGRFRFTTDAHDFWLVIVHPSGVGQIQCSRDSMPKVIKLTPWARVEGTYRVARQPKANAQIVIAWHVNLMVGPIAGHLVTKTQRTTDANGRFVFERVLPGKGQVISVWRRKPDDSSELTSTASMWASFVSGKTTQIDFGARGRPVIGRVKMPTPKKDFPWSLATVSVHEYPPLRGAELNFEASVESNGDFSIDDVPAGKYWLNVSFRRFGGGRLTGHFFDVPQIDEKLWQRPVDLGVLTLSEDPFPIVNPVKKVPQLKK